MMKLIFDLGANVGGNIDYYLSRADTVIAVEANPELVDYMRNKFSSHITYGRLHLVPACLTVSSNNETVNFFIHRYETGLGRFTEPQYSKQDYKKITVQSVSYKHLIASFGLPDFVKIDLEGFDNILLNHMIQNNLLPDYLQFENQGLDILEKLLTLNKYKSFNIVPFYNFSKIYGNSLTRNAGPIGLDIKSPWLSQNNLVALYHSINHSWFDIHLSAQDFFKSDKIDMFYYSYKMPFINKIKLLVPEIVKSKIKLLINYRKR